MKFYDITLKQHKLRSFKTELADVSIRADMQVNIDGFLRFEKDLQARADALVVET